MMKEKTQTGKNNRVRLMMMFVVSLFILTPSSSAQAQFLPEYDYSGTWTLKQSNGITVALNLHQDERGRITGTATYDAGRKGIARGTVKGSANFVPGRNEYTKEGDRFDIEITWHNTIGVYRGENTIESYDKRGLRGETYDKNLPNRSDLRVPWYARGSFKRNPKFKHPDRR